MPPFPHGAFATLGYETAHHGDGRWNGVAIASRVGLSDVTVGLGSSDDDQGSRLIGAVCGGVQVMSVYVPNGRSLDSEYYQAKLVWLAGLRSFLEQKTSPDQPVAVCGDFNVAPEDRDVWSPAAFEGDDPRESWPSVKHWPVWSPGDWSTCSVASTPRTACSRGGTTEAVSFHRHQGMRIDLLLMTEVLAQTSRLRPHRQKCPQGPEAVRPHPGLCRHRHRRGHRPRHAAVVRSASGSRRRRPALQVRRVRSSAIRRPVSAAVARPVPVRATRATAANHGDG